MKKCIDNSEEKHLSLKLQIQILPQVLCDVLYNMTLLHVTED